MFKRTLSVALVLLLVNLVGVRVAFASTEAEKQARFAEKVRAG